MDIGSFRFFPRPDDDAKDDDDNAAADTTFACARVCAYDDCTKSDTEGEAAKDAERDPAADVGEGEGDGAVMEDSVDEMESDR